MKILSISLLFSALYTLPLFAQNNPAQREDARVEREKVLRAADQLEILLPQLDSLKNEVQTLKTQVDRLQLENAALKKNLSELEVSRTKERDALLDEVSKIMAESKSAKPILKSQATTSTNTTAPAPIVAKPIATKPVAASTTNQPAQEQVGYEHVVGPGQTVSSIAKAFNEAGVKVTVKDIIQANHLDADAKVRIGQKLFIPKK
ncbi:MAG: LysM peptidoglycan-binding domain-containing protein [Verrucomicrobiae bacterium]|nr:LysM peptidoglycan-binding domain-containing protein [Verrucomicrobiae bacterium]